MAQRHPLHIDHIAPVLALVEERGISASEFLDTPQLEQLSKTSQLKAIHWSQWTNLVQRAIDLTGDPTLAFHHGLSFNFIQTTGAMGFAMMSCENVLAMLKLLIRYTPLVSVPVTYELVFAPNTSQLQMSFRVGSLEQRRMIMEASAANILGVIEFLLQQVPKGIELHLNYPAPAYASSYEELLSIPVRFDQPQTQMVFSQSVLEAQPSTANPAAQAIFLQQCEQMLRDLNRAGDVSAAVRRLLIQASGSIPDIKQVATQFHMSESSLRRRLREESTSYRQLLGEVRNILACEYLTSTKMTVAEIAGLLDYTETVNFRRAFVRWNDVTPQEYRKTQSNGN
ncbi:MAG: AraC-like DNA-binding protein [Halioglobus sp.]|jgi:AraC-like DNA-binding protein